MILRGLQASIRCHEQVCSIYFGTTNRFTVDPIHVDGFVSHAIRRDSALAPHKNLNVWRFILIILLMVRQERILEEPSRAKVGCLVASRTSLAR